MGILDGALLILVFGSTCYAQEISPSGRSAICGNVTVGAFQTGTAGLTPVLGRGQAAMLLLLGFGGFSVLLAVLYMFIRRHVFHDADNLNTTFDAGGRVSVSLTAVTVASQLLWPGDLLQSATVTIKNGVAGSFWYSSAAVINMIMFPVLSVQFKTRAPGAKTFLQVIHARFGTGTHVVFCCFALLLNLVVIVCLVAASTALLQSLVKDASDEFCVVVMATLFGSYSFVGGLGSTFYVSYFNAAMIFSLLATFIVKVYYVPDATVEGGFTGMYERVKCLLGPEGNEQRSFLTFWSEGAIIWAIQGFFACSSITFCDQASWQSRIAAKPTQGVLGFFVATYIWFAIPSTIGTSVGFAYLDYTASGVNKTLSTEAIDSGLVTAFMAQEELGVAGSYMILTMLIMALMSTGSGEVMAVSSIIVFDVYQTHIKPFRQGISTGHCLLCGLLKASEVAEDGGLASRGNHSNSANGICRCPPAAQCQDCRTDMEAVHKTRQTSHQAVYRCAVHGEYRMYQDMLMHLKSWVILWVTVGIVPLGLVVIASGVDLNWIMLCGFILTVPCFPGALMTIIWVRTTSSAMMIGSLGGLVGGLAANFIVAATYEDGLGQFLRNTSENYAVLAGSCTAFGLSLGLTVALSLATHNIKTSCDEKVEWQKLRDIDNPLYPWADIYQEDLPDLETGMLPSYEDLDKVFRSAKLIAYIGGAISIMLFICVIPGVMASLHVLSEGQFRGWVTALQIWCLLATAIVIVVVPLEEVSLVVTQMRRNTLQRARGDAGVTEDLAKGRARATAGLAEPDSLATKMITASWDAPGSVLNDSVQRFCCGTQRTSASHV